MSYKLLDTKFFCNIEDRIIDDFSLYIFFDVLHFMIFFKKLLFLALVNNVCMNSINNISIY